MFGWPELYQLYPAVLRLRFVEPRHWQAAICLDDRVPWRRPWEAAQSDGSPGSHDMIILMGNKNDHCIEGIGMTSFQTNPYGGDFLKLTKTLPCSVTFEVRVERGYRNSVAGCSDFVWERQSEQTAQWKHPSIPKSPMEMKLSDQVSAAQAAHSGSPWPCHQGPCGTRRSEHCFEPLGLQDLARLVG